MARKADRLQKLHTLLRQVRMQDCTFDHSFELSEVKIPRGGVTAWIKARTRVWRETWVIPIVQELYEEERERLADRRVRDAVRKKSKR